MWLQRYTNNLIHTITNFRYFIIKRGEVRGESREGRDEKQEVRAKKKRPLLFATDAVLWRYDVITLFRYHVITLSRYFVI